MSIWALVNIQPDNAKLGSGAATRLSRGLEHEEPLVRIMAARALGQMGPRAATALPALRKAVEDGDPHVRQAVEEAIKQLQKGPPPPGKPPLKPPLPRLPGK